MLVKLQGLINVCLKVTDAVAAFILGIKKFTHRSFDATMTQLYFLVILQEM